MSKLLITPFGTFDLSAIVAVIPLCSEVTENNYFDVRIGTHRLQFSQDSGQLILDAWKKYNNVC